MSRLNLELPFATGTMAAGEAYEDGVRDCATVIAKALRERAEWLKKTGYGIGSFPYQLAEDYKLLADEIDPDVETE